MQNSDVQNKGSAYNAVVIGNGAWGNAIYKSISNRVNKQILGRQNAYSIQLQTIVFIATPVSGIRDVLGKIRVAVDQTLYCDAKKPSSSTATSIQFVMCSKGIETDGGLLPSEICEEFFPRSDVAVFSGPNFANEIAQGILSNATIASRTWKFPKDLFNQNIMLIEQSKNIISTQIFAAMKNVYAIASGILTTLKHGKNTQALLFQKSFKEAALIASRLAPKEENIQDALMSPSGIGDFFLTCTSTQSRNMCYGAALASGKQFSKLAEGVLTLKTILKRCEHFKNNLPICNALYNIVHQSNSQTIDVGVLLSALKETN